MVHYIIISSDLDWGPHHQLGTPPPTHNIKGFSDVRLISTFLFNKHNYYIQETTIYISLVRSQLMFCSTLWKPYLLKDIRQLQQLQRHTTKYILNDYIGNCKCDRACKNRACGHDIFLYFQTSITHNFLYHYAIAMQFSALGKHLICKLQNADILSQY